MKNVLLASACLFALGVSAANASDWAITLDGGYEHASQNGFDADGYYLDGAAAIPLNWSDVSVELDLGDRGLSSGHNFDGGGSVVWNMPDFRLAGTVVYNQDTDHGSINETQIGGGGEFYVNPWLTVSAQGGGIEGDFNGGYVGGTVKAYVMPNLSIGGNISYTNVGSLHETDYGVRGEWQVSDTFPVAINGGYTRADFGNMGGGGLDFFFVGLTLHMNNTPVSLVESNRTGTLDTIGAIHPVGFTF